MSVRKSGWKRTTCCVDASAVDHQRSSCDTTKACSRTASRATVADGAKPFSGTSLELIALFHLSRRASLSASERSLELCERSHICRVRRTMSVS